MIRLEEVLAYMRANGVKSLRFAKDSFSPDLPFYGDEGGTRVAVYNVELSDTIPAPPPSEDESLGQLEEPKPAGVCRYTNCGEPANSLIARGYCRFHALGMCGVGHV